MGDKSALAKENSEDLFTVSEQAIIQHRYIQKKNLV